MKRYEIIYKSVNIESHPKPITALVVQPEKMTAQTGVMLFTHGWGCNRYYDVDKIEFTCDRFNLICVSVEYRDCGYEFNPVTGQGYCKPYDTSFYQVFDVLNGLRTVLDIHPKLNRKRIFHFARSQGANIALIGSMYAPQTFAALFVSSPITHLDSITQSWAGRDFTPAELSARNMIEHADRIRCPVFIDHGTGDTAVPHGVHTAPFATKLKSLGKTFKVRYYAGGEHDLSPATTMFKSYKALAVKPLTKITNNQIDDFKAKRTIEIPCEDKRLRIDWSKPTESAGLFTWK